MLQFALQRISEKEISNCLLFVCGVLASVCVMLHGVMKGLIPYLIAECEYRMSESPYTMADNIPQNLTISGNDSPPDMPGK